MPWKSMEFFPRLFVQICIIYKVNYSNNIITMWNERNGEKK